jgi:hypothetical protein
MNLTSYSRGCVKTRLARRLAERRPARTLQVQIFGGRQGSKAPGKRPPIDFSRSLSQYETLRGADQCINRLIGLRKVTRNCIVASFSSCGGAIPHRLHRSDRTNERARLDWVQQEPFASENVGQTHESVGGQS